MKAKITIGTPYYETFRPEYAKSLAYLAQSQLFDLELHFVQGTYIHQARNLIWNSCKSDWLLFIDSDMQFNGLDVQQLIEQDKPISSGVSLNRFNGQPNVFRERDSQYEAMQSLPAAPFTADGVGAGFLLIQRQVLDDYRLPEGPFDLLYAPIMSARGRQIWGEDLSFCRRMQTLGYQIWVHPGVRLGHVSTTVLGKEATGEADDPLKDRRLN